jgi:hypothetical protein
VVLYLKYISLGIPTIFSGIYKELPHHSRGAPIFTKSINTEANYLIYNRISLNFCYDFSFMTLSVTSLLLPCLNVRA